MIVNWKDFILTQLLGREALLPRANALTHHEKEQRSMQRTTGQVKTRRTLHGPKNGPFISKTNNDDLLDKMFKNNCCKKAKDAQAKVQLGLYSNSGFNNHTHAEVSEP